MDPRAEAAGAVMGVGMWLAAGVLAGCARSKDPVEVTSSPASLPQAQPLPWTRPPTSPTATAHSNVLLVVLDDVGVEVLDPANPSRPTTPTIDSLAATGVRFEHAWAAPACSQGRGALLTGRYTHRFGLGWVLSLESNWTMPDTEVLLPEMLTTAGYTSVGIGKWHLGVKIHGDGARPVVRGFTDYALNAGTLGPDFSVTGFDMSYWQWEEYHPDAFLDVVGYDTAAIGETAQASIAQMPEPWFAYLAFNAPHEPLHEPPAGLKRSGRDPSLDEDDQKFRWMIEAVDTVLQGVLADMDPEVLARTVVYVTADNGSDDVTVDPAFAGRAKGTVYEHGVTVPLIVSGPGIVDPGRTSDAHVSLVDLYPTIAGQMGATVASAVDGVDLAPLLEDRAESVRTYDMVSKFGPTGCDWKRAIRDERYKWVGQWTSGTGLAEELYDLETDPDEAVDLYAAGLTTDAAAHADALTAELARLIGVEMSCSEPGDTGAPP